MMQFCIKTSNYQGNSMLNICDADLVGTEIQENELKMKISKSYYGEQLVDEHTAQRLLQNSSIINMVGKGTVSLSIKLGIGSEDGIKRVNNVPFLIVFKM